jgi:hypothetical protein
MFLLDLKGVGQADCDAVDSGRLNRWARYRQKLKESLRQRFKKVYLGQLVLTAKKKGRKLQPREVVLLGVENKRIDWPLAVVEELIPGQDGEVRLVRQDSFGSPAQSNIKSLPFRDTQRRTAET